MSRRSETMNKSRFYFERLERFVKEKMKKVKLQTIAHALDIDNSTLHFYRRGYREPTFSLIVTLSEYSGKPLEYWMRKKYWADRNIKEGEE